MCDKILLFERYNQYYETFYCTERPWRMYKLKFECLKISWKVLVCFWGILLEFQKEERLLTCFLTLPSGWHSMNKKILSNKILYLLALNFFTQIFSTISKTKQNYFWNSMSKGWYFFTIFSQQSTLKSMSKCWIN